MSRHLTGDNCCEVAAMLIRCRSDEWIAYKSFNVEDFALGRVYFIDGDVRCSITRDSFKEWGRSL